MATIAVALGGNSLLEAGQMSIDAQRRNVERTASILAELDDCGYDFLVTHGNGPQVGQLLLANEAADVAPKPLDVLVAETQAQIGYLLQQAIGNELGIVPATVVTRTRVDPDDPAFDDPTKPIGPFYEEREAAEKPFPTKRVTTSTGEKKRRRVVASPRPIEIVEIDRIDRLLGDGRPVVCAGGGGISVIEANGSLEGVEAVIDKDYATATLAAALGIDELLFLTDVDGAYRNFGTDDQELIDTLDPETARGLLSAGEFGDGSMAPKIDAASQFVENGGDRAIVTSIAAAIETLVEPGDVPSDRGDPADVVVRRQFDDDRRPVFERGTIVSDDAQHTRGQ